MPEPKMCPIHGEQMWWNEGRDGRQGWYSHKTQDSKYPKGYCNGKPPAEKREAPQPQPNMLQLRLEIAKMCNVGGAGIDWDMLARVQGYVLGGIIPQEPDPFPPEAA